MNETAGSIVTAIVTIMFMCCTHVSKWVNERQPQYTPPIHNNKMTFKVSLFLGNLGYYIMNSVSKGLNTKVCHQKLNVILYKQHYTLIVKIK